MLFRSAPAIGALTRVRAFATVAIIGVYLVTNSVWGIVEGVTHGTAVATFVRLFTPFELLDGFQAWAFGVRPVVPPGPGQAGPVYGLVLVAVVAGAVGALLLRYRRAEA